uniref:PRA1 family protein n=1 Tax=Ananas comosus var. bracteatus TaxID=296719 RepID=A0A6V7QIZ3_ANACO|nr:unnamed protein product [Ananas comosus var. bracteatus]
MKPTNKFQQMLIVGLRHGAFEGKNKRIKNYPQQTPPLFSLLRFQTLILRSPSPQEIPISSDLALGWVGTGRGRGGDDDVRHDPDLFVPGGAGSPLGFISRAKERGYSALATRRPWREMADPRAFGFPLSLGEAYLRIRTNLAYFAMNYAIVVLVVVFLSLLWHPISLIVFIAAMIAWLFLYFLRDEPLVLFGRTISDTIILAVLAVVTLVLLLLTNATLNILVSLLVGLLVVVAHAALRKTEHLYMEEEAAGPGRWYTSIGEGSKPSTSSRS